MDSDRVLVMDAGEAVEFDHPFDLLANKDGFLYNMVENTERNTADSLRDVAAAVCSSLDIYEGDFWKVSGPT